MMTELEKYYNKFNEEKRLKSRHGQVEFITSMKYIHKYLPKREQSGNSEKEEQLCESISGKCAEAVTFSG